jgi:hypothetical protein
MLNPEIFGTYGARPLVLCPRNDLYYVRSTAMLKHAEKSSPCEFDAP